MMRSFHCVIRAGALAGLIWGGMEYSQGADVQNYFVRKGRHYDQTSAAAPTLNQAQPAIFIARVSGRTGAIQEVSLATPSQIFGQVPLDDLGDRFEFLIEASVQEIDDFFAPNGDYTFTIDSDNDGFSLATLSLTSAAMPGAIPQVLNFAGAQTIDPATAFTLTFAPFTGAGAGDHFEFEVLEGGSMVYSQRGTGTSATIPADTLTSGITYDGRLRFVHDVDTDTTSYPGATGTAGVFNETQFSLSTGGGGGGDDTTPPMLVFTNPQNGATGVAVNSPIIFAFSEPMARQQAVQWSANVTPANFSYTWVDDQNLLVSYNGGLPGNATITWNLVGGAAGFRDVAGNALPPGFQGSFSTGAGGGGGGNCGTNQVDTSLGYGSVRKVAQFVQTGTSAPAPDTEDPASAIASYKPAQGQTVSSVRVQGPNGIDVTLTNLFGTFLAFREFPSAAAVDTAFPVGNYTITANGAGTGTLALPAVATVPVPRIINTAEFAAMDRTRDFVLQFAPFTGAGPNDTISISITGQNDGGQFFAPDYCIPRPLTNTATSVTIPANTFKPGVTLNGSISFSRFSINTNSIPNTTLTAGAMATTQFTVSGGTPPTGIRWSSFVVNANGTISYTVQAPTGTTSLIVEGSTNLTAWAQAQTLPLTGGTGVFTTDKSERYRFFRARTP